MSVVDLRDPEDIEEGDACTNCGIGEYYHDEDKMAGHQFKHLSADQRDKQMFCDFCEKSLFEEDEL